MDKDDIIRDMLNRMEYKKSPDKICDTCTSYYEDLDLECRYNPIYPFVTQPASTCAHHKYRQSSLNNLNRLNYD